MEQVQHNIRNSGLDQRQERLFQPVVDEWRMHVHWIYPDILGFRMIYGGAWDAILRAWFFSVLLIECAPGAIAETMCLSHQPIDSPKMLTTYDYPIMVTASQCRCTIIPFQTIEELTIQMLLKRSDRTTTCSHTQMTIVHRNISNTICPFPYKGDNDDTEMTESLALTMNDRPVITLWNTHLEFISAQIVFTSEIPVVYGVVCTELDGSFVWPFDDQGMGFDDGIDAGIKVAIVVLFFVLSILISATIRLLMRLRWRKMKLERQKEQARLKRIDKLKQAEAIDNMGFSCTSLNHSSSTSLSYCKVSHNGKILVFPVNSSTSLSSLTVKDSTRHFTGQGSIWPNNDGQTIVNQISNGRVLPMSNNLLLNLSSSSSQVFQNHKPKGYVEQEHMNHRQSTSPASDIALQHTSASRSINNSIDYFSDSRPTVHMKSQNQASLHHEKTTPFHHSQPERGNLTNQTSNSPSSVAHSGPEKDTKSRHEMINKWPKYKKEITDSVKGTRTDGSSPDFVRQPKRNGTASRNRDDFTNESEI